ncbi:hypothetical protein ACHAXR_000177, partial [Thalassiosira sp. AJA248-18]
MSVHHSSKQSTTVAVGTPPPGYSYDEAVEACVKVHFHGFASLPAAVDEEVESPQFTCFGHNWTLDLYPGGYEDSNEGMIAVHLCHHSNGSINVDFDFIVRDLDGTEIASWGEPFLFDSIEGEPDVWGEDNFAERTRIIDEALIEGTLVIEIRMKLVEA